ncbi:MAG: DNA-3-methyladenine glycosylase, partial [Acidobacteria bacterium]|nr:DNA-3-methyladenine glycosylase [Acidobacteriota bacterium]
MVSGKSKPVNRRISSKITPAGLDPKVISGLPVLARSFYAQPAQDVAAALIGQILVHRPGRGRLLAGRIVEAEAYLGLADRAAHAYAGRTPRTKVLFGPPGHAYVYLIYGMYHCLNFVTEPEGSPGCVLIRALEPLAGILDERCDGPGRLTRALGVGLGHYGRDLTRGLLTVHASLEPGPNP